MAPFTVCEMLGLQYFHLILTKPVFIGQMIFVYLSPYNY